MKIEDVLKLGGFEKDDTRSKAMDKMMRLKVLTEHDRLFIEEASDVTEVTE